MTLLIMFVVGLFVGLVIAHILNRAILKNIERYEEELAEYFQELVKALKRKYEPSYSVKDLLESTKPSKKNGNNDEVKQALLSLKFSPSEADKAIASLPEGLSIEEQVKLALKVLLK